MKTQTALGSFISLMRTLEAQLERADNAPIHPQAEVVVLLPLRRLLAISLGRQLAEEQSASCRVFRYSSSTPRAPSSSFIGVLQ